VRPASDWSIPAKPNTAGGATASWVGVLTAILIGLALIWVPHSTAADQADRAILLLFPKPEEVRPWVPDGPAQLAEGQDLFALIDGGAELFLRHGFERAAAQSYALAGSRHIQVEIDYLITESDGVALERFLDDPTRQRAAHLER